MSLRTAARLANIDAGHLSKVERGERQLSMDALHRLATVLELKELVTMLALYLPPPEPGETP
jgi:transcriptional regulator with XRE-family HTH domain